MIRLLLIILCFLTTFSLGQTPKKFKVKKEIKDTIDYSKFTEGILNQYTLTVVKQFKGEKILNLSGRQLFFFIVKDQQPISGPSSFLNPQSGDTIMTMEWDSDTKDVYNTRRHLSALIHLNRRINTITVTKQLYDSKQKKYIEHKKIFKILKWTFSGITLKDITNLDFKRTYYFNRWAP